MEKATCIPLCPSRVSTQCSRGAVTASLCSMFFTKSDSTQMVRAAPFAVPTVMAGFARKLYAAGGT